MFYCGKLINGVLFISFEKHHTGSPRPTRLRRSRCAHYAAHVFCAGSERQWQDSNLRMAGLQPAACPLRHIAK